MQNKTDLLVASNKGAGTPVYHANGDRIGHIETVLLDGHSGRIVYAVVRFAGALRAGEDRYHVPWSLLIYNERLGAYQVSIVPDRTSSEGGNDSGCAEKGRQDGDLTPCGT